MAGKGVAVVTSRDYFEHVDGLRAVALLGVLFFHFGVDGFEGGFLGVDCFLVISGFLMTWNITRDIGNGSFKLSTFYVKRFWRLYPSFLVTTLSALIGAYLFFSSSLAVLVAQSALASMGFMSNVYFLSQADYFDVNSQVKPLLHMWSLSLEEQYYMFWPVLLKFLVSSVLFTTAENARVETSRAMTLGAISVSSFLASIYLTRVWPEFSFFMLPSRLFEFGVGGLVALLWHRYSATGSKQNTMSIVGLLAIVASYRFVPPSAPVYVAIGVVLGTAAIILSPDAALSRLVLCNSFVRYIGTLSYSAYLTHWVLWVYLQYIISGLEAKPSVTLMMIATFASAWVLHKVVEVPFRRQRQKLLGWVLAAVALGIVLSLSAIFTDGWVSRYHNVKMPLTDAQNRWGQRELCKDIGDSQRDGGHTYSSGCLVGSDAMLNASVVPILVTGNSFARHILPAFNEIAHLTNHTFHFQFMQRCKVTVLEDIVPKRDPKCLKHNRDRWELIKSQPKNSVVLLADNWKEPIDVERLEHTVKRLREYELVPVIIGPPPGINDALSLTSCHDMEMLPIAHLFREWGFLPDCRNHSLPFQNTLDADLLIRNSTMDALYVSMFQSLNVADNICRVVATSKGKAFETSQNRAWQCRVARSEKITGDALLYETDGIHWSLSGSREIYYVILQQLRFLLPDLFPDPSREI